MTVPSGGSWYDARREGLEGSFAASRLVTELRSEAALRGGFVVSGGPVSSMFGGTGRPTRAEARARRRELLRLLADGHSLHEAAAAARVKPTTVLRLMSEREFRQAACALMDGLEDAA